MKAIVRSKAHPATLITSASIALRMESYVVVRLPSSGTVIGDAVRSNEGSSVTSVLLPLPGTDPNERMDLMALAEGLPDFAVAQVLLAWNLRYGLPGEVLGDAYALRLPVAGHRVVPPVMAEMFRMDRDLAVAGNLAKGDWVEQWIRCLDSAHAARVAGELAGRLAGWPGVRVATGQPRSHDLECWEMLRMVGGMPDEILA